MTTTSTDSLPSDDKRVQSVDRVMQRYGYQPEALIETLHAAQEAFGYLDVGILTHIARRLRVPPSRVCSVTTFYNHFQTKPPGDHTLVVCTGTACHVKGSDRFLMWVKKSYDLSPGETTADSSLSLLEVRCVGACAMAPVMITDGTITGKSTLEEMTRTVKEWLNDAP